MTYTNIDSIVRSALMTQGVTIHYYLTFMHMALKCLREIHLHHLGAISSVELTVNQFREIQLPDNYIDWIKVGYKKARYVVPMGTNSSYNRLPRISDAGQQIAYDQLGGESTFDPYNAFYYSQYGEDLGKAYGLGEGTRLDVFKVIPERGVVQIGESVSPGDKIVLEYLAQQDFTSASTLVSPYAEEAIESYIAMKFAEVKGSRVADIEMLRRNYSNARRMLRASNNELTKEELIRLSRGSVKLSIKG